MKKTALFFIFIGIAIHAIIIGVCKLLNLFEISGVAQLISGLFYFLMAFLLNYLYRDIAIKEIKKGGNILKFLAISEKLSLSKSDGQATIVKAEDVFKSWIDSDFQNWGLNKESKATPETEIEVYEMVKDATFKEIFISLSDDLDSLCFTQSQIIDFCKKHRNHLRQDGDATLFLTKKDFGKPVTEDNLFVVYVDVDSHGLNVFVDHFDGAGVWSADDRHRLVVPKLS